MSVKQESKTVLQTLIAKTLKGPLCAPASQGILEMELAAQVGIQLDVLFFILFILLASPITS